MVDQYVRVIELGKRAYGPQRIKYLVCGSVQKFANTGLDEDSECSARI